MVAKCSLCVLNKCVANNLTLNTQSPLSFVEWRNVFDSVENGNEPKQYSQYLSEWFNNKKTTDAPSTQKNVRVAQYRSLVDSLVSTFRNDLEIQQLSTLNFDRPEELLIAIPYLARKLKEIAIYYERQRNVLKNTKLKYNLIGSEGGLQTIVYDFILNEYTQRNIYLNTLNTIEYQKLPRLEDVFCDFDVCIKELWDESDFYC